MSKKKVPSDRYPFTVLGRDIGTGSGWDQIDMVQIVIYDFIPSFGVDLPRGDLSVEYDNGYFKMYDDDVGEVTWSADMVERLRDVSLSHPAGYEVS